jgi:hypothetical protein
LTIALLIAATTRSTKARNWPSGRSLLIGLEVPVSRWSLEHAGVHPQVGSGVLLAALGILAFSLLGAAIRGVNLPSGSHLGRPRRPCAQSFLRDGSPLPYLHGHRQPRVILAVIFNRCAKCRQILAGLCLCAVLGTSVAAGAKLPPPRAVGPIASTAIGTASTYVGQVRFVDDQVNGNVYKAVREDDQRRRIALYDAEPLVASNTALVMGPTGRIIGFSMPRAPGSCRD